MLAQSWESVNYMSNTTWTVKPIRGFRKRGSKKDIENVWGISETSQGYHNAVQSHRAHTAAMQGTGYRKSDQSEDS